MDVSATQSSPAANNGTPEVDVTKRDAANGLSPGAEEPPSKKVRLEESSQPDRQDRSSRDRGIAPIKAEYGARLLFEPTKS